MTVTMVHLNSNCLCAVYAELTGREIGEHDIYQICILPLDAQYKPRKDIIPFCTSMKPWNPLNVEKMKGVDKERYVQACLSGLAPYTVADMLQDWFQNKLRLREGKKIMALSYDWLIIGGFIRHWLGNNNYDLIFHPWFRDIIPCTMYANDSADHNVEQLPYPKSFFSYIGSTLGIKNDSPGDALSDCIYIADCYKHMLRRLF